MTATPAWLPIAWQRAPRTAPFFPASPVTPKPGPEAAADARAVRILGGSAGPVLGLVLPVAQRHEFRLRHVEPPAARSGLPPLRPDARHRSGDHPGHGRAGLRVRQFPAPGAGGVPPPAPDRRMDEATTRRSGQSGPAWPSD